jgi:hypothetical protein
VTAPGDGVGGMTPMGLIDDATIEAMVRGDDVPAPYTALATLVRQVQTTAERQVPSPSPALRELFVAPDPADTAPLAPVGDATVVALPLVDPGHANGDGPGTGSTDARAGGTTRPRHAAPGGRHGRRHRSLGGRVAVGAGVALAGIVTIAGAGAAGVLPGPVRTVVEFVSPVDPPSPHAEDDPGTTVPEGDPARGAGSEDAPTGGDPAVGSPTTTPGGVTPGGVTPADPADPGAPGDGADPADPADPATPVVPGPATASDDGIDRAGDTPAEPRLPTTTAPSPTTSTTTAVRPGASDDTPGGTAPTTPGAPAVTAPGDTAPRRTP